YAPVLVYLPNRKALRSDDTEADWPEATSVDPTDARDARVREDRTTSSATASRAAGGPAGAASPSGSWPPAPASGITSPSSTRSATGGRRPRRRPDPGRLRGMQCRGRPAADPRETRGMTRLAGLYSLRKIRRHSRNRMIRYSDANRSVAPARAR